MKIGPDGSLCRITSSYKDVKNNVGIIHNPNEDPPYRIVVFETSLEREKLSDTSEEYISDEEYWDIKFPSKNIDKEKVIDNKNYKLDKQDEACLSSQPNEGGSTSGVMRDRNQYNRHQQYHKNNNRYNRRNNTFNKMSKHYKNLPNRETYNYGNREFNNPACRDFNSRGNQNFNSAPIGRNYNSAPNGRDYNLAAVGRDYNLAGSGQDINSITNIQDFSYGTAGQDVSFSAGNQDFTSANSAVNIRDYNSAAKGRDFNSHNIQDFNNVAKSRDFNSAANKREFNFGTGDQDLNFETNQGFTLNSNQDFSSAADHHVNYSKKNYQQSDFPPSPWINNHPPIFPEVSHAPFCLPGPGLLGDHPSFCPPLPVFQPNQPNDQELPYPTMTSNFSSNNHNSSFIHNQNRPYPQKTSNYPSSKKTDNFINNKNYQNDNYDTHGKNNQLRNRYYRNADNKRRQNAWNRGIRGRPNYRSNSPRNKPYEYRK